MMRVLTVRQPWAHAIIAGGKDVENRTRNLAGDYRGPIAIHAGAVEDTAARSHPGIQELARERWGTTAADLLTGRRDQFRHIIGVADLVGVHYSGSDGCGTREGFGGPIPLCSEWAQTFSTHLVLANPRPLHEPIPFKGALGLRTLDASVEALIGEAL